MITKDYQKNKQQVLALYDEYVNTCKATEKKVDASIEKQANKIKDEVFNLMVLGEAKSGKSTFINAYLGEGILPMDVRQCTSAIIKVHHGDLCKLTVTTAAGGQHEITGKVAVREYLKEHAAISDKYRAIPITTINDELINLRGRTVTQQFLRGILDEVEKDNIYNLDAKEYAELIQEYIEENAQKWESIITQIDISYPLSEAMHGITIIDSPGVGAGGNVGKVAEDYIENADAIIFVKYLKGQALESSSFKNFFDNNCRKLKKDVLFLVLNGKLDLTGLDFERVRDQALKMFTHNLDARKILFVDSKAQLFLNRCNSLVTEDKIDAYFDELDKNGEDFPVVSKCWLKCKGDVATFNSKMETMAGFAAVSEALERFARSANYQQLLEFLENIEKEYKRISGIFSEKLKIAQENADDPIALEDRINQKKREIAETFNRMNSGIREINMRYMDNIGGEGIIPDRAAKMQSDYEKRLDEFSALSEDKINENTFNALKTASLDAIDESKKFRDEIARTVIEECNEKLIQCENDPSKIPVELFTPNFTGTDFDQINQSAEEKSVDYKDVETGVTFTKVEKKPFHNKRKHINIVIDSIRKRLSKIVSIMTENVRNYVTECLEVYKEKLAEHKKELEEEYDKLQADKNNNDRLLDEINRLKCNCTTINQNLQEIESIKEAIKNYVEC